MDAEISLRFSKAVIFGRLLTPVFLNSTLSTFTKHLVYQACVLSVLLYGSETWTVKAPHLRRLSAFHHQCVRRIMGVTRSQQWYDRLTTKELSERFGMLHDIDIILRHHHLRWLGHISRMSAIRLPKQVLFAEGVATRPRHGPKRRWRDLIVADLRAQGIAEETWMAQAEDRSLWWQLCTRSRPPSPRALDFICSTCGRAFRRSGDLKRHSRFCD